MTWINTLHRVTRCGFFVWNCTVFLQFKDTTKNCYSNKATRKVSFCTFIWSNVAWNETVHESYLTRRELLITSGWMTENCMSKIMVLSTITHTWINQTAKSCVRKLVSFQTSHFDHIEFNQVIFLLIKLWFIQLNSCGVGCLVWKIMAVEMYAFSTVTLCYFAKRKEVFFFAPTILTARF